MPLDYAYLLIGAYQSEAPILPWVWNFGALLGPWERHSRILKLARNGKKLTSPRGREGIYKEKSSDVNTEEKGGQWPIVRMQPVEIFNLQPIG